MAPGPMPPQGPPQGAPPPSPSPQPEGPPGPPQGDSPAMKFVSMAQEGLQGLGTLLEQAQGQVSPQELQKFGQIVQAFESFISEMGEGEGPKEQGPPPGGPMPAMAGKGSVPA